MPGPQPHARLLSCLSSVVLLTLAVLVVTGCRTEPRGDVPALSFDASALRHAKVAVPRPDPSAPLVYFAREAPSEAHAAALAAAAPHVRFVTGLSREEALGRAAEADGADVSYATPEFLRAASRLRWVQARSAGVDRFLAVPELVARDELLLTNYRGVHGPAIADHTMAMLLALTRDLPGSLAAQREQRWSREAERPRIALAGRTMLVVGLGGIGSEIAVRAHGMGMRVIATRRSVEPAPSYVERVGTPDQLRSMLAEADVVAIAVPLTAETEGLFDADLFAAMRKGSYLLNIARGKVVRTDALLAALREGHLAGAGLDVTDPEPLPADHPLWKEPNVIITAHIAADAELTEARGMELELENMRRFDRGEPLLNVVDKKAGY
jgi:phosphoglycerate dehydrogenase-like enzyme